MIALGEVAAFDYAWDDRAVILYALSVGARVNDDLALLYEGDGGRFRTAPTFALAPMAGLVMPMVALLPTIRVHSMRKARGLRRATARARICITS